MAKKIITINDIEFVETDQSGSINFYSTPEFQPYNKHFKASVAYLPLDKVCYKIIRWGFSVNSNYRDERFPQYDVLEIGTEETVASGLASNSGSMTDLSESEFESWLIRTQMPVI